MNELPPSTFQAESNPPGYSPLPDSDYNPGSIQSVPIRDDIREIESLDSAGANALIEREKQIAIMAKAYLPMCKAFVAVYDSAVTNVVSSTASNSGYSDDESEEMGEKSGLKTETKDLMIQSSSRICARRVKDPEYMDIAGLAGAFAEHLACVMQVIKYIRTHPRKSE